VPAPEPRHAFGQGMMRHGHAIEPPRHQMSVARVDRVPERGRIRGWNGTKVCEDGRGDRIESRIRETSLGRKVSPYGAPSHVAETTSARLQREFPERESETFGHVATWNDRGGTH
jgi:hypothetical protein